MAQIAFTNIGTFAGVGNTSVIDNPTSIDFGPDGRLYVTEQSGSINAFTVELVDGEYVATAHELIVDANGNEVVKNIQNHYDDGTEKQIGDTRPEYVDAESNPTGNVPNADVQNRQVTGILTSGTEENPVLYIVSSDPAIASNGEEGLDTNSGVLSRATWTGTEWEVVDLIRGFPRSEENHANNGMVLSNDGAFLYIMVGGNTNNGAPSSFFSNTAEYALSGTLLEIDLAALDALPVLTDDGAGQDGTARSYIYDLPTLDDPNVENVTDGVGEDEFGNDEDGPWGGNDGLNQAILPSDAPLRIYADGFRNAYDVAIDSQGNLYTIDNGSNNNLGDAPNTEAADDDGDGVGGEALNTVNNGGSGAGEPFFLIEEGGYYGHANPTRANQNQAWTVLNDDGLEDTTLAVSSVTDISELVPDGVSIADGYLIDPSKFAVSETETLADLVEADAEARLLESGVRVEYDDPNSPAITILGSSTNGILVYNTEGSAFDGSIDDAVFVVQFNSNVTLLNVDPVTQTLVPVLESGPDGVFGTADDVTQADGEDGILSVANLSGPLDLTQGPDGTIWVAEFFGDQIAVLAPTDLVLPGDTDSDDDGLLNAVDPFVRDANNGLGTVIDASQTFLWDFSSDPAPGPGGFGGGLTGVLIDNVTDFEAFLQDTTDLVGDGAQVNLDNVKFTTAAGGGTTVIENVSPGTPDGASNSGAYLFHTGVSFAESVATATVSWVIENPGVEITGASQQIGGYLGTGDQFNFLKVAAVATGATTAVIEILLENEDGTVFVETFPADGIFQTTDQILIDVLIDRDAETATPTVTYGGGTVVSGSSIDLTGTNVLSAVQGQWQVDGQDSGVAVGLYSSNDGQGATEADRFQAIFNDLIITATERQVAPVAVDDEAVTGVNEPVTIAVSDLLANDTDENGDLITFVSLGAATNGSVSIDDNGTAGDTADDIITFTPDTDFVGDATFDYTITDGNETDTGTVAVTVSDRQILFRVNAGGPTIAAIDDGPDWTEDTGANQSAFLIDDGSNGTAGFAALNPGTTVPASVPGAIFDTERFDVGGGTEMEYGFSVANGIYEVNLFLGNGAGGTSAIGARVFDIAVEGTVPDNLDDIDLVAENGHLVGALYTTVVEVVDNQLNIEFLHGAANNPLVNGIEIVQLVETGEPTLPEISIVSTDIAQSVGEADTTVFVSILANQTLTEDVTVTFEIAPITGTAAGEEDYDYAPTGLLGSGTYVDTVTIAANSSDVQIPISILDDAIVEGLEQFSLTITDVSSNATLGAANQATISIVDNDGSTAGPVITAINSGGPALVQDGISFVADDHFLSGGTYTDGASPGDPLDQTDFDGTVFETERFGNASYEIPVGTDDVIVEIYLAEIFATTTGFREFDLSIEGQTILSSYDILAENGGDPNTPIVINAGTFNAGDFGNTSALDIDLQNVVNNAKISGIVVRSASEEVSDSINGVPITGGDFSSVPETPTSVLLPENGSTTITSNLAGSNQDRDFITITIPEGQRLVSITLDGYDGDAANAGFLGVKLGDDFVIDPAIPDLGVSPLGLVDADDLDGGIIYDTADIGTDILPELSGTGVGAQGFDASTVTGDLTLWFNQGGDPVQTTLTFVTEAIPVEAGEVVLAVNAGGEAVDGEAYGLGDVDFEADTSANPHPTFNPVATGGNAGNNTNNNAAGATFTGAAVPDDVFTSERFSGNFQYNVDLADGEYVVDLYFAETFFPNEGQRVQDVLVEGTTVLDDYDIVAEGGGNLVKIIETVNATVTDGQLNIQLESQGADGMNNAKISAFVVRTPEAVDTTAPVAAFALTPPADENADIVVTLTLSDNVDVDDATVDAGDVVLTGAATPTGTTFAYDAETNTATYTFAAPAGGWLEGNYTATLAADSVLDTSANGNVETVSVLGVSFGATPLVSVGAPADALEAGDDATTTDLIFPVTFDAAPAADVTVEYSVDIAGSVTTGLTAVIPTTGGSITVSAPNDDLANGDEQVTVTLTGVTAGDAALGTTLATSNVTEDDAAPVAVADTAGTQVNTPITFNPAENDTDADNLASELVVTSVDTTATVGGTVSVFAGEVTVTPDTDFTGTITFGYTVVDPAGNASVGTASVTVSAAPIVSVAAPADTVEAGDIGTTNLDFPVTFDTAPAADVTVEYSVNIAGVETPGLTQVIPTTGGTISVAVPNDDLDNGAEAVTVTLTGITAGDAVLGTTGATANVLEDDFEELETVRVQAEDGSLVSLDQNFYVQGNAAADGALIRVNGNQTGIATYDAGANLTPATYLVTIAYFDENDGESTATVEIGDLTDTWVFDDDATSGNGGQGQNIRVRELGEVAIGADDILTLTVNANAGEFGRIDYIEFIPVGPAVNNPPVSPTGIEDQNAAQGVELSFSVADDFTDPDGDALTFAKISGPDWVTVAADGTVSGTPGAADVGTATVEVQATDTGGLPSSVVSFDITVAAFDNPPTTTGIANQAGEAGLAFDLDVTGDFADVEDTDLEFAITAGTLPTGVTFADGVFSGTPTQPGNFPITVEATDDVGQTVTASFILSIEGEDTRTEILIEAENFDTLTNMVINSVGNASGDALTRLQPGQTEGVLATSPASLGAEGFYTAVVRYYDETDGVTSATLLVDGVEVGAWQFDEVDGTQVNPGTPTGTSIQVGNIREVTFATPFLIGPDSILSIEAGDGGAEFARIDFVQLVPAASPANQAPVALGADDVTVGLDEININLAATFSDPEGDAITYSLVSGPAFLSLSPEGVLSGTPDAQGDFTVEIGATDAAGSGVTVTQSFTLTVDAENEAPTVNPLGSITLSEGATLAQATDFTDPEGLALSYSLGAGAPAWLAIDAVTGELSGTPANEDVGVVNVDVIATDPGGISTTDTVEVTVENVNEAPQIGTALANQNVEPDAGFSFALPADAFSDADLAVDPEETLTLSATLIDGSPLPAGVTFDPLTGNFSGTLAASTTLAILVTATDAAGLTAQQAFTLTSAEDDREPITIEAEAFDTLSNMVVNSVGNASGDQLVRTAPGQAEGFISTTPASVGAEGYYTALVRYYDETDGVNTATLLVDGVEVGVWDFDQVNGTQIFPNNNVGTSIQLGNIREIEFTTPFLIGPDSVLTVEIDGGDAELGRVDFVTLVPTSAPVGGTDLPPVFGTTALDAAENQLDAGQVVVTDPNGDAISYAITGGADATAFDISSSGALTFLETPNFEAPLDADGNGIFEVEVTATANGLSTAQTILVTVTDENDAPTEATPLANQAVTINEEVVLPDASAVFADEDLGDELTIQATGLPDGVTFEGTAFAGTPTVAGDFVVTLTATDVAGAQATSEFTISVVAGDLPPVFTTTALDAAENQLEAGQVVVTDPNDDAITDYQITGGADAAAFTISATGLLSFVTAPNFEAATDDGADGVFEVEVTATANGLSTAQTILVTVTDENDAPTEVAALADVTLAAGEALTLDASGVFADEDLGDTLTIEAVGLPDGVTFDGTSFAGTPSSEGSFLVTLTATDAGGAQATSSFSIVVGEADQFGAFGDFDGDEILNGADSDDDNDGIDDNFDDFQFDDQNGILLAADQVLSTDFNTDGSPFANVFTGYLQGTTNGGDFDEGTGNVSVANGLLTVDPVTNGDTGGGNNPEDDVQVGIKNNLFTVETTVLNPTLDPDYTANSFDQVGVHVGVDSENFAKIVLQTAGDGGIEFSVRNNDFQSNVNGGLQSLPVAIDAFTSYEIRLEVDGTNFPATIEAFVTFNDVNGDALPGGEDISFGTANIAGDLGIALANEAVGVGVGLTQANGSAPDANFVAQYDSFSVTGREPVVEDVPEDAAEVFAEQTDLDTSQTYDGGAVGSATLTVNAGVTTIDTSNFNADSFLVTNTGDKGIAAVFVDVTSAIYPDSVFDPDGAGGDSTTKPLGIDTNTATGAFIDGSGYFLPGENPLPNTTGSGQASNGGFRGALIKINPTVDGGFETGEVFGFSGDMDPNSIAGLLKNGDFGVDTNAINDWDVGGVSGHELIGSTFTVLFDDGTTAEGQLISDGSNSGSHALATQDSPNATVALSINGSSPGSIGTYGGDVPQIIVSGDPGDTVRLVMSKGFQPAANDNGGVADLINARLADDEFTANNVYDSQTFDITIGASGVVDASTVFEYTNTPDGGDFAGDDIQDITYVAAVIDSSTGLPIGPVTDPIILKSNGTPVDDSSGGGNQGYFEIVNNNYFKIQVEDQNIANGGINPGGNWFYETAPDEDGNQAGFQGEGYYRYGTSLNDEGEVNSGINDFVDGTELLEYTIFIPEEALGTYRFNVASSRDGVSPSDQQNDVWLNFKHAEVEGFGNIEEFLTEPTDEPEPFVEGFVKLVGAPNNGSWSTAANNAAKIIDGEPGNFLANVEITEAGLYTIQLSGRSNGFHMDYIEFFNTSTWSATNASPGASAANSPFILTGDTSPTVISLIDDTTLGLGGTLDVSSSFTDLDGDALTFSATGLPTGVTISTDGVLTVAADAPNASDVTVTVTAEDDDGNTAADSFELTVLDASSSPVLEVALLENGVTVDGSLQDGDQIDVDDVNGNLNFNGFTPDDPEVDSIFIELLLGNTVIVDKVENSEPWNLAFTPAGDGLAVGDYTYRATFYSGGDLEGDLLGVQEIDFSVVSDTIVPEGDVTVSVLVDGAQIDADLVDGDAFDVGQTNGNMAFSADITTAGVSSVLIELLEDGVVFFSDTDENAPWTTTFDGGLDGGNYTYRATLYSEDGQAGDVLGVEEIDFTVNGVPSAGDAFRIEAEDLPTLTNYAPDTVESGTVDVIKVGSTGSTATASGNVGDITAGTYQVVVSVYDENDGTGSLGLSVGDVDFDFVTLDGSLGGSVFNGGQAENRVDISFGTVALQDNDEITLTFNPNGPEFGRVDYIDFIPVDDIA